MAENRNNQNQEVGRNQNLEQRSEDMEQRTSSNLGTQDREQQTELGRGESSRETGLSEEKESTSKLDSDRNQDTSI